MPQGDMNVANDSGANVRSDINDQLAALVQLSSGASAPGTTFAHMLWADTTPTGYTIIKIRDAADAVFSTLFDDEGNWKGVDGSAAAPSITFGADIDTGFYRIGADQLGFATGGMLAVSISAAQDVTFAGQILSADGSSSFPGMSFASDTNTGFYRIGADEIGLVAANGFTFLQTQVNIEVNGTPTFQLHETDQIAEKKKWQIKSLSSQFRIDAVDDAEASFSNAITITRSAAIVDIVFINAPGFVLDGSIKFNPKTITTDTTPTAIGRAFIIIGTWAAGNDITDFDNETAGQKLTILGGDSDCNVVDGAPIQLVGGTTWNGAAGATLELISNGTVWFELSRSDAS